MTKNEPQDKRKWIEIFFIREYKSQEKHKKTKVKQNERMWMTDWLTEWLNEWENSVNPSATKTAFRGT